MNPSIYPIREDEVTELSCKCFFTAERRDVSLSWPPPPLLSYRGRREHSFAERRDVSSPGPLTSCRKERVPSPGPLLKTSEGIASHVFVFLFPDWKRGSVVRESVPSLSPLVSKPGIEEDRRMSSLYKQ
jgi:hypothetical protein